MSKLRKGLGLTHIFAIASGAMISSGLFVLPGLAHSLTGPSVIVSYVLAGLLATAGAMSIAELATAMPKAGGDYFFITRGMGAGVGTVAGMLSWFSLSLKSAFAIVGMATFVQLLLPIPGLAAGAALCALFVGVNLLGVKEAARAQVLLVAGLLVLMVVYVAFGVGKVQVRAFEPFATQGPEAIFTATGFVFVSFGGLLNIASMAEEVRRPGRTIPTGLMLSLVVVTLLYALMVFVTVGVLPGDELNASLTPISDGGQAILGRGGFIALSIGAILAFVSTANAGIMSASRYLFAISRDGLLPAGLSRVSRRFHTPWIAVLLTGGVILASLLLKLKVLVEAASTVLILTNLLACLSVIVLRESKVQNYRPAYRVPGYPWIPLAGIMGLGFVLVEMGPAAYLISAALVLGGFAVYWFFGRRRVTQESALLHLLERLTARELVTGTLEQELKQIVRERDEIELDRFDQLVEDAPVLDLKGPIEAEELFSRSGDLLSARVGLSAGRIADMLRQREKQSSTLLSPTLAVPHVVIEGEGKFELLLVRVRGGVEFSPTSPGVEAVFVLMGTPDERNFHLRVLAAIAQVAQEADFLPRWRRARGQQGLRDVILLGKRQRH